MKGFPRADAADFRDIYPVYENLNNFSNLSLITPIPSRVSVTPPEPLKDTISSLPVILPIEKKKRNKRRRLLRPSRTIEKSSSPGKNNPLKISFSKFHVTSPRRSGYNRIYEIRRSRSFFFELDDHPQNTNDIHLKIHTNDYHMNTKPISYNNTSTIPNAKYQMSCMLTHFFSSQRVLPRAIQQKYFNYIRDKLLARHLMVYSRDHSNIERNRITKTFFYFTYKRYRFHFGIYTPCQHHSTHSFSSTEHICNIPVPFVMSKHRRACVSHQRQFFSEKLFHKPKDSVSIPDGIVNSKALHANLIYDRWKNRTKKSVFSNRLGISYQEAIHARDVQSVLEYGNKHMYRKRLTDFQLKQSNCLKVKEKQETRFLRACRRVFKTKEQNIPDPNRHRLRTAQRYRFLFLKSQYINKPVKHLQYNHGLVSEDYGFSTPHYYKTTNHADSRAGRPIIRGYNHLTPEISPYSTQPWVREYDPYPDMFIPYKYRDIIPKDPLYTDTGDYIRPGSRLWFTYMCNLHRRISSATTSQERKYLLQSEQERERETRELLQKEQAIKAEARYYGTSVHTLSRRRHASKMLTGKTRHFHERMNYLTTTPLKGNDVIRHAELNAEMESFELYYNSGVNFNERSKQATRKIRKEKEKKKEITSDDTKELEHRPKKRNTALVANNFFHTDEDRHKRNRPSEVSVDTTAVAGPSRIKF
ncbi:hypothetical protein RhiirA1_540776 [Rhizophagus irregularis]|uniref:DUF8211 domain-containing protein n=2 Tax=Rhizophagus irregularis TaxID=588596 RepID=A0A2N0R6K5_9GLOM|nr:hypothetical protein RhiirA1_540776 [Rhizophagus irregularis]